MARHRYESRTSTRRWASRCPPLEGKAGEDLVIVEEMWYPAWGPITEYLPYAHTMGLPHQLAPYIDRRGIAMKRLEKVLLLALASGTAAVLLGFLTGGRVGAQTSGPPNGLDVRVSPNVETRPSGNA